MSLSLMVLHIPKSLYIPNRLVPYPGQVQMSDCSVQCAIVTISPKQLYGVRLSESKSAGG